MSFANTSEASGQLNMFIEQRDMRQLNNNSEASCSYNAEEEQTEEQEPKQYSIKKSNVAKVIQKMKLKEAIKDVNEERISECIKSSILRKKLRVHGKMRKVYIICYQKIFIVFA